jgi:phosphoribosylglycinamide formyltransferase-1
MNKIGGLKPCRWCVFISGRGSNFAAALEGVLESSSHRIELLIATSDAAAGVSKARRAGVPVIVVPKIDWDDLNRILTERKIDAIFLLGFMKIVPKKFIDLWPNRIVNLHPSLLPAYPGLNSIERAHTAGDALGASIHLVVPAVDAGAVLKQRRSVEAGSSLGIDDVSFRVHLDEQRLVKELVQRPIAIWQKSKENQL